MSDKEIRGHVQISRSQLKVDYRRTRLSEEHGGSGNHSKHPQPLPPLNPHEGHDDHINDVFRTRTELEG
jgi:hypothetical protein